MLRNADEKTVERLSAEYPQADGARKDRIYAKIESRINGSGYDFTDEVSGVEKYRRRPMWKAIPVAAMCLAVVGGTLGGGLMLMKNNNKAAIQSTEVSTDELEALSNETTTAAETTTEAATDAPVDTELEQAYNKAVSDEEVTKDYIFSICANGYINNFDKISYTYNTTNYVSDSFHESYSGEYRVDNVNHIGSYTHRDDVVTEYKEKTFVADYVLYNYNNNTVFLTDYEGDGIPDVPLHTYYYEPENDTFNEPVAYDAYKAVDYLEDFNDWEITSIEDFNGRRCAVVSGTALINANWWGNPDDFSSEDMELLKEYDNTSKRSFTFYIDIQTGVWMKSDIVSEDPTSPGHDTFEITEIAYGDAAKTPISADEIKSKIDNGSYQLELFGVSDSERYRSVQPEDYSFLG